MLLPDFPKLFRGELPFVRPLKPMLSAIVPVDVADRTMRGRAGPSGRFRTYRHIAPSDHRELFFDLAFLCEKILHSLLSHAVEPPNHIQHLIDHRSLNWSGYRCRFRFGFRLRGYFFKFGHI